MIKTRLVIKVILKELLIKTPCTASKVVEADRAWIWRVGNGTGSQSPKYQKVSREKLFLKSKSMKTATSLVLRHWREVPALRRNGHAASKFKS
jgi:hypothetical protein